MPTDLMKELDPRRSTMKKTRKLRENRPSREPPGSDLEKAVARVQQLLDPNSQVTHNEKLTDRVGNVRQYDVVIRGRFAGRDCLGVIECKDHGRRKGPGDVEAFAKKAENLGANIRIMVARMGFTARALKLASFEHVVCLSLLSERAMVPAHSIGEWWYGEVAFWTEVRLIVHFHTLPGPEKLTTFAGDEVRWQGKPVIKWFMRDLITAHSNEKTEGRHHTAVEFSQPREMEIGNDRYLVKGLACDAIRVYKKKRKWVSWSGDAFYDWQDRKYLVAGQIVTTPIETDVSLWDDYAGEFPAEEHSEVQPFVRVIVRNYQKWDDSEDVVDLSDL
jgi:hypothetical protein